MANSLNNVTSPVIAQLDLQKSLKYTALHIKCLEEKYAKYLFDKYVKSLQCTLNSNSVQDQELLEDEEDSSPEETNPPGTCNPAISYSQYVNRLFIKRRAYITQHELLVKELEDIAMAGKLYEENPDFYPTQYTEYGYPDEFRCNYIKKASSKHKLQRCSQKIAVPNSQFYCTKHMLTENCFLEEYNKLASVLT